MAAENQNLKIWFMLGSKGGCWVISFVCHLTIIENSPRPTSDYEILRLTPSSKSSSPQSLHSWTPYSYNSEDSYILVDVELGKGNVIIALTSSHSIVDRQLSFSRLRGLRICPTRRFSDFFWASSIRAAVMVPPSQTLNLDITAISGICGYVKMVYMLYLGLTHL